MLKIKNNPTNGFADRSDKMSLLDMIAAHFAERILSNVWLTDQEINKLLSAVDHKVKAARSIKVY